MSRRVRQLILSTLTLPLVAIGTAPATSAAPSRPASAQLPPAAATPAPTAARDTGAYAELVAPVDGTSRVRIAVGSALTPILPLQWWEYAEGLGTSTPPTGSITVSSGGRTIGTFALGTGATSTAPAAVVVPLPGAVFGTTLTVVYSGDTRYRPATHQLSVVEPGVEVRPTVDLFLPNGDGTFQMSGSLHVPTTGTTITPWRPSTVTIRPVGNGPGGVPLTGTTTAAVSATALPSGVVGFATRYRWSVDRIRLGFSGQAYLHVDIPATMRPYYVPQSTSDYYGNLSIDTVQVRAKAGVDGLIEVSHFKGPDPCDLVPFISVGVEGGQFTTQRWAPEADGSYCRGTVTRPQGQGVAEVGVDLLWPSSAKRARVALNLSPAPRTVTLGRTRTATHETITVTSSPAAAQTVLELKAASGRWTTFRISRAAVPVFELERRATPNTYRVRVAEDDAARGVLSEEVTVVADPARGAETRTLGVYRSHGACQAAAAAAVAASGGEWNGYFCRTLSLASLTIGYLTYQP